MSCVVLGCKSRSSRNRNGIENIKLISFHRFPKDANLRQKWIDAIGRCNWEWKKPHRVCSRHFTDDCFINIEHKYRRLDFGAVPSLHLRKRKHFIELSRMQTMDKDSVPRVTSMNLDNEVVVKLEPDDNGQNVVVVQDPLSQNSAEGSFKELHSHAPGASQSLYMQLSALTNEPVIKEEIVDDDYKSMFMKLQQEVEILKADNQSLMIENHNLAREIYNLKRANPNAANASALATALEDIKNVHRDNELLRGLAKENQRLGKKICEFAEKIKLDESGNVSGGHENLENLTDKLRRINEDYNNIVSERDSLKDTVQNLLVDLENLSKENKELKKSVKFERKKVEVLRIQCVDNSETIKRLKNSNFKLRSMYSKLQMAR